MRASINWSVLSGQTGDWARGFVSVGNIDSIPGTVEAPVIVEMLKPFLG
jgi:hypothetical protein